MPGWRSVPAHSPCSRGVCAQGQEQSCQQLTTEAQQVPGKPFNPKTTPWGRAVAGTTFHGPESKV